jgi:hypothetical protein
MPMPRMVMAVIWGHRRLSPAPLRKIPWVTMMK